MLNKINRFIQDESGATVIEYGLIVGLIAIAIMISASKLGEQIANKFTAISNQFDTVKTVPTVPTVPIFVPSPSPFGS